MTCAPGATDAISQALNRHCFCVTLRPGALHEAIGAEPGGAAVMALLEQRCPYVFAASPVFLSARQSEQMRALIAAVEGVIALPAYRARVLADAPAIARHDPGGPRGVFFGYDFHAHDDGIGLIEINTNAGGAMLNTLLARAQKACCAEIGTYLGAFDTGPQFERDICAMFAEEWRLARGAQPLRTIAIVDEAPAGQYLYPEFLLFQQLFERQGWRTVIAAPSDLQWHDGALRHHDVAIDLVYNRLTDFLLDAPASAALRAAYLAGAVVLTPHPQAHALYADKRNLALLSDAQSLQELGVRAEVQAVLLAAIPRTERVRPEHAERLWRERRGLFFKPAAGYGSRAAYRGDKLTKGVWQDILAGDYIAQAIVAPGQRVGGTPVEPAMLKFDLRNYSYAGKVQWTAARLYQGQTTNFRTPGGGFAPVYRVPEA